ncbi:MAG TPA: carbohydrate-binding family 9-like protein [Mucilaginibacter sp.]|nr:carbohydrate-binding family 9-like protein [Mucilaginibacter sp.]
MIENSLYISRLPGVNQNTSVGKIAALLEKERSHPINIQPWPEYPEYYALPKVTFKIAHGNDCICIKYDVEEHEVLARYRNTNDPVYKDSCVEFFMAFGDEKGYYNLEFNRLGTCLGGFGISGETRASLPSALLETIKYERSILQKKESAEPTINWTLMMVIPLQVFCFHKLHALKGRDCRVNFYKCGDDLTQPHFLAWKHIVAPRPDFHQPDFFGDAVFA